MYAYFKEFHYGYLLTKLKLKIMNMFYFSFSYLNYLQLSVEFLTNKNAFNKKSIFFCF